MDAIHISDQFDAAALALVDAAAIGGIHSRGEALTALCALSWVSDLPEMQRRVLERFGEYLLRQ